MRSYRPFAVLGAVAFALAFGHVEAAVVAYIRLASTGTIDGSTGATRLMTAAFP